MECWHPHGDSVGGEEVWDVEQSEGGWGGAGNGIWSVKNELQIKLNLKKLEKKEKLVLLKSSISCLLTILINDRNVYLGNNF